METTRIYSYAPIWASGAQILILGTAPSRESLKQGFYYAHPRNAFWPILADIFGAPPPSTVDEKKALLTLNQIALWDVAHSCVRPGPLDQNIRDVEPNDVPGLLERCPQIRRVLFNGSSAHTLYQRFFKNISTIETIRMPSTSPAYTLAYARKLALWQSEIKKEVITS